MACIARVQVTSFIDGKDAMNVHPTKENLTYVRCKSENGIITFEFTRPLNPNCNGRVECMNVIDPTTPLKVVWAMGAKWSDDDLSERNMHSVTSSKPVRVLWLRGSTEADQELRPVLAVHGFMMFLAWGVLLPGGIMAARYLKHVKGDGWFKIHVYLQYSGISIVLLGLLFAAAELRGFPNCYCFLLPQKGLWQSQSYSSASSSPFVHVKFGIATILLAIVQPLNAFIRPPKLANGEVASSKRIVWEYFHVITGRGAIIVGIVALFTGMKHLGSRYGGENVQGLTWALILWILVGALLAMYWEYLEVKQRRRDGNSSRGSWVLGKTDEEDSDSVDLLHPNRTVIEIESHPAGRMEVQLESLGR